GLVYGWRRQMRRLLRSDFAIDRTTAGPMLVAIVAVMTLLAALALSAERGLMLMTAQWTYDLADSMTIELPTASDPTSAQPRLRAVLAQLSGERDLRSARPVERERVAGLLEPWLGTAARAVDLPIPELIEVSMRPDARIDVRSLEAR